MRILGIDPGLATIGLGLIEATGPHNMKAIEWLTIKTKAGIPLPDRLQEIHKDLAAYVKDAKPDLCVIERVYFSKNVTTGIDVSQARGVILTCIAEQAIRILEPTPSELKSAVCGDGKADKTQMQTMMMRMLELQEIPKPDDAADALALAVFGALNVRSMIVGSVK
jgi:crossover junction endodeoxyribonuclease RuvC